MKVCSKCGQMLSLDNFHKNGFNRQGKQKYRGYCKICANKREIERYWEKREFVDAQRTKCEKCGESRVYVLDFHHKNKSEKSFTIGAMKHCVQSLQKEIEKCVCLCANCHREFHYLEKAQNITIEDYLQ